MTRDEKLSNFFFFGYFEAITLASKMNFKRPVKVLMNNLAALQAYLKPASF